MTIVTQVAGLAGDNADRRRSQDYYALMTCHSNDGWLVHAQDQLASWLTEKDWDVDVTIDGRHQSGTRELEIVHHDDRKAASLHARLVERGTPLGTWTTELIAHDRKGDGDWISLRVENDKGHFVGVPRLGKYLMQTLPLGDGSLEFTDKPQVFHQDRVDDLIELLCDDQRHGLVFVAGTSAESDIPFDIFVSAVGDWTREVFGLAQVIVLDPAATNIFGEAVGSAHGTPPWTIRTYLPGVDPASSIDARRHRILGTNSLADLSKSRVRNLLGGIARYQAAQRPEPSAVVKLRRTFERLDNKAIVAAIAESVPLPAPSTAERLVESLAPMPEPELAASTPATADLAEQVERYLAEIQLAKSILRVTTLDEETLRRIVYSATLPRTDPLAIARAAAQIDTQQSKIEELEDRLAGVADAFDDEQLEHAVTTDSLQKRDDEARWLRGQLQDQGAYEVAFGTVPLESLTVYPDSFPDLLARLRNTEDSHVVFTGDADIVADLDGFDLLGKCRNTAWEAVLALSDYVRAREEGQCEHGFDHYVKHTPTGYRQIAPAKFAHTETGITMERYGSERIFSGPEKVNESGHVTMTAHFKLGRIGMVSPRMYVFDDYTRTGKVYIGYIGPHLTNTQTN